MPNPRGKFTRSRTPKQAKVGLVGEPEITIAAWCPDEKAEMPPEQVHLIFTIPGLEELTLICRYKSPDTLGFIIEELANYRREVWPDAEPLNTNGWIPVEERLPEDEYEGASAKVLIAIQTLIPPISRFVRLGHYDYHRKEWREAWGRVDDGRVTHWHVVPPLDEEVK